MVDLFDEVDEELRSDRAVSLIRNAMPWVIGVLALVLAAYLGFWGYTSWQDRNLATAAAAYQKAVDALGDGDQKAALAGFDAVRKTGAPGYATLALMQEGNLKLRDGDSTGAAKLYDQAAARAPNLIVGDLARLKAAEALLDTAPLPQLQTRLNPLLAADRPYAIYAREALAMAKLMAGKTADARKDFQVIGLNLQATQDMRERSQMAIVLIDSGEASTAVAAAKAAATMPPPVVPMVGPTPAAPQGPAAAPSSPAGAAQ
ncbi:MAG TPA: tetratricopeptide repeat protein [Caulobacteraceae bacterium]|nr:tetratricopeptide repeat protein [Caulobacteraceae bacterium]